MSKTFIVHFDYDCIAEFEADSYNVIGGVLGLIKGEDEIAVFAAGLWSACYINYARVEKTDWVPPTNFYTSTPPGCCECNV